MNSHELVPTIGVSAGMTVQFAEGSWRGEIGEGVSMSDAAFNVVEPYIFQHCRDWTSEHRYGVFELGQAEAIKLSQAFREAKALEDNASFFSALADWLEFRLRGKTPILILGY